jgi:hypothetical protein
MEIISLRNKLGFDVTPINYLEVMEGNRKTSFNLAQNILEKASGITQVKNVHSDYPYSVYDFEYIQNNVTRYALVFFTATTNEYFSMPAKKIRFCNDFSEFVDIFLFTDVLGRPKAQKFSVNEINRFRKEIGSITYTAGGDSE